jgi:hypothetical protein
MILATSSAKDNATVSVEDAKELHTKMWKLESMFQIMQMI